jgi:hypothetical protein
MKALLIAVLFGFTSLCYAHTYYYDCPQQQHKQGYFFTHFEGRTYPDYQYPRFGVYSCKHTMCHMKKYHHRHCHSHPRHHHHHVKTHGFFRCYNCKGYTREFYRF